MIIYILSVDNELHSVLGSNMLNNQSNNSFSSHKFKSEVDVNVRSVPHKSDTVCNFNTYIDALLYDDFDDSYDVSVILQQDVPCLGWRDLLKGTSPQAHLTSTNPGGGSLISNTNTDTNNKFSQLKSDCSAFESVRPGFESDSGHIV